MGGAEEIRGPYLGTNHYFSGGGGGGEDEKFEKKLFAELETPK